MILNCWELNPRPLMSEVGVRMFLPLCYGALVRNILHMNSNMRVRSVCTGNICVTCNKEVPIFCSSSMVESSVGFGGSIPATGLKFIEPARINLHHSVMLAWFILWNIFYNIWIDVYCANYKKMSDCPDLNREPFDYYVNTLQSNATTIAPQSDIKYVWFISHKGSISLIILFIYWDFKDINII